MSSTRQRENNYSNQPIIIEANTYYLRQCVVENPSIESVLRWKNYFIDKFSAVDVRAVTTPQLSFHIMITLEC